MAVQVKGFRLVDANGYGAVGVHLCADRKEVVSRVAQLLRQLAPLADRLTLHLGPKALVVLPVDNGVSGAKPQFSIRVAPLRSRQFAEPVVMVVGAGDLGLAVEKLLDE